MDRIPTSIKDFKNICRICGTFGTLQPLEQIFIELLQKMSNITVMK